MLEHNTNTTPLQQADDICVSLNANPSQYRADTGLWDGEKVVVFKSRSGGGIGLIYNPITGATIARFDAEPVNGNMLMARIHRAMQSVTDMLAASGYIKQPAEGSYLRLQYAPNAGGMLARLVDPADDLFADTTEPADFSTPEVALKAE